MKNIIITLLLMVSCSSIIHAQDEDIVFIPYAPEYNVPVYFRITKSDIREGEGAKTPPNIVMDISITYLGNENENLHRLTYLNYRPEDEALAALPAYKQALEMYQKLSIDYVSDETGTPIAVHNLEKLKADLLTPALDAALGNDDQPETSQAVRNMFESLSAEAAAELFLRDIQSIFSYTGTEVSLSTPYEAENRHIWQLTGTEIVTNVVSEVVSFEADRISLKTRSGYSRESILSGLETLFKSMAPADKKANAERIRELETFDMRQELNATVSVSSGWPIKIQAVTTADVGTVKRVITYVIERQERPADF